MPDIICTVTVRKVQVLRIVMKKNSEVLFMFQFLSDNFPYLFITLCGVVSTVFSLVNYKKTGKITKLPQIAEREKEVKTATVAQKDIESMIRIHAKQLKRWEKVLKDSPENSTAKQLYEYHKSMFDILCTESDEKDKVGD